MKWLRSNWLNIVLTVLATKLFESVLPTFSSIELRQPLSVLKNNPSFQAGVLAIAFPIGFLTLYSRRWKFNIAVSDAFAVLVLGGLVVGYLLPFMVALSSGNIEPLVEDMRTDPFSKVILFMFVVIWIGKDVLKTIVFGRVAKSDVEPERRMPRPSDTD